MDNRRKGKSHRSKKQSKPLSWKLLTELDSNSDCDSEGTTGSVGGYRDRDSSEYSSTTDVKKAQLELSNLFHEEGVPADKPVPVSQTTASDKYKVKFPKCTPKKRNYVHRNNKFVNSFLNTVLVGALLMVSGLATGHYYCSQQKTNFPTRVSPAILNRYVTKTVDTYKKLMDENLQLREKVRSLEERLGITTECPPSVENTDQFEDMISNFQKLITEDLKTQEDHDNDTIDSTSQTDPECAKATVDSQTNGNDTDNTTQTVNLDENDNKQEEIDTSYSTSWKRNKSGYVYNLRKLFEPSTEEFSMPENNHVAENTNINEEPIQTCENQINWFVDADENTCPLNGEEKAKEEDEAKNNLSTYENKYTEYITTELNKIQEETPNQDISEEQNDSTIEKSVEYGPYIDEYMTNVFENQNEVEHTPIASYNSTKYETEPKKKGKNKQFDQELKHTNGRSRHHSRRKTPV